MALRLGARSRHQGLFERIDRELLLRAVRHRTERPWVLLSIERWVKAPAQMENGSIMPRKAGRPQAPGERVLHYAFDMCVVRTFPHIPFERYPDDAICHCKSAEEARAVRAA